MTADPRRLLDHAVAQAFGSQAPARCRLLCTREGSINTVLHLRLDGEALTLRVRVREALFRYEHGLAKEALAAALLSTPACWGDDAAIAAVFTASIRRGRGGPLAFPGSPELRYFDHSGSTLGMPYSISTTVHGVRLGTTRDPASYRALGARLACLHQCRFSAFHHDLRAFGADGKSWHEAFPAALQRELDGARNALPADIVANLEALDPRGLDAPAPCLVHNDIHGSNVMVSDEGEVLLLDWDNWVVDAPELDFAKLRHWTRSDAGRGFTADGDLFEAAVAGHAQAGGPPLDQDRMALYELLWLLRVTSFERAQARHDLQNATRFAHPEARLEAIRGALQQLGHTKS